MNLVKLFPLTLLVDGVVMAIFVASETDLWRGVCFAVAGIASGATIALVALYYLSRSQ